MAQRDVVSFGSSSSSSSSSSDEESSTAVSGATGTTTTTTTTTSAGTKSSGATATTATTTSSGGPGDNGTSTTATGTAGPGGPSPSKRVSFSGDQLPPRYASAVGASGVFVPGAAAAAASAPQPRKAQAEEAADNDSSDSSSDDDDDDATSTTATTTTATTATTATATTGSTMPVPPRQPRVAPPAMPPGAQPPLPRPPPKKQNSGDSSSSSVSSSSDDDDEEESETTTTSATGTNVSVSASTATASSRPRKPRGGQAARGKSEESSGTATTTTTTTTTATTTTATSAPAVQKPAGATVTVMPVPPAAPPAAPRAASPTVTVVQQQQPPPSAAVAVAAAAASVGAPTVPQSMVPPSDGSKPSTPTAVIAPVPLPAAPSPVAVSAPTVASSAAGTTAAAGAALAAAPPHRPSEPPQAAAAVTADASLPAAAASSGGGRYPARPAARGGSSSPTTGSTISASDGEESEPEAAPMTRVTLVRATRVVPPPPPGPPAPALPNELLIDFGAAQDVVSRLLHELMAIQRKEQDALEAERAAAASTPASAIAGTAGASRVPDGHLTRTNVFVALRCLGVSDVDAAALLFGVTGAVEFSKAQAILERESLNIVRALLLDMFAPHDKFRSCEVPLSTAVQILAASGVGNADIPEAFSTVVLGAAPGNQRLQAVVRQQLPATADAAAPAPLVTVVDVTNPTFQLFVDAPRGELIVNGAVVCRAVDDAGLAQLIQALQAAVHVAGVTAACTLGADGDDFLAATAPEEPNVDYGRLTEALLALPAPALGRATDAPPAKKSLLREHMLATGVQPLRRVEFARSPDHVEPFLARSLRTADHRRRNFLPGLRADGLAFEAGGGSAAAGAAESALVALTLREVHVPQLPAAVAASATARYLLVSTMNDAHVVLPAVRLDAKPFRDAAKGDGGVWQFSKKPGAAVVLCGSRADVAYIEVCYETTTTTGSGATVTRTACAGFATTALGSAESGVLPVKAGTYFHRTAPDGGAAEDAPPSGCLCFGGTPVTRIVVDVDRSAVRRDAPSPASLPARYAIRMRHWRIAALFRELLVERAAHAAHAAHVLRDTNIQIALAATEEPALLDAIARAWEELRGRFSREQRNNLAFVRAQLLAVMVRASAGFSCAGELGADVAALQNGKPLVVKPGALLKPILC